MMIDKKNMYEILYNLDYENHNTRLIVEDLIKNHNVQIFYYQGTQITTKMALDMYGTVIHSNGTLKYISILDYLKNASKDKNTMPS